MFRSPPSQSSRWPLDKSFTGMYETSKSAVTSFKWNESNTGHVPLRRTSEQNFVCVASYLKVDYPAY